MINVNTIIKPFYIEYFAYFVFMGYYVIHMVVRMRHTRAHTANRRSHHALKGLALSTDTAGATHIRHRAGVDGMYKGRTVVGDPVKKVLKKQGKKPVKKVAAKKKAKK